MILTFQEKSNHLIFSGSKKEQISTCNSLRWVLQNTAVILTQKSNIEYTLHSQNLAQHMGEMKCIQYEKDMYFLKAWSISSKYLCGQKQKKVCSTKLPVASFQFMAVLPTPKY